MSAPAVTLDFKTVRKSRGLTQIGLAVAARTSETMINKIEVYGYIPGYAVRNRLRRALGVEMADLWPDVNDDDYK